MRANSPTSPSSVAEKNIVWRLRGSRCTISVDLRLEAHVEHAVGLVENEDANVREVDESPVGEILQAAGGGDQDVCALRALGLGLERHAAVDGATLRPSRLGERLELLA